MVSKLVLLSFLFLEFCLSILASELHLVLGDHSCVYSSKGARCWGANSQGQLGTGDLLKRGDEPGELGKKLGFINFGSGLVLQQLSLGEMHTCALFTNGRVKCVGLNGNGQLGVGDDVPKGGTPDAIGDSLPFVDFGAGKTVTHLFSGWYHNCVILNDGGLKCWGRGGAIGSGDENDRGTSLSDMGNNLPYVDLGTNVAAKAVCGGARHTCVLLDNAQIKCFGDNASGQLGLGGTRARGQQQFEMGDNLSFVDLGEGRNATQISCGIGSTCALLNTQVLCFGANSFGQLGVGNTDAQGDDPYEVGNNLTTSILGNFPTSVVTKVASFFFHRCALFDNRRVKCWGKNSDAEVLRQGNLGLGDTNDRGGQLADLGNTLPFVDVGDVEIADVAVGAFHSCVLLTDDRVKCFGGNINGQLGLGDSLSRGDSPGEMGNLLPFVDLSLEVPAESLSLEEILSIVGASCAAVLALVAVAIRMRDLSRRHDKGGGEGSGENQSSCCNLDANLTVQIVGLIVAAGIAVPSFYVLFE